VFTCVVTCLYSATYDHCQVSRCGCKFTHVAYYALTRIRRPCMPKLTKTVIDRLERSPPAKGYALHWDELRGFAARVTAEGRVSRLRGSAHRAKRGRTNALGQRIE
jgi:hypothetical protein